MSPGVPSRIIAACSGLAGFAVAIVAGLKADNPAEIVLTRALVALVACQLIGWIIGAVGEQVVRRAVEVAAPIDASLGSDASADGSTGRVEVVPNS